MSVNGNIYARRINRISNLGTGVWPVSGTFCNESETMKNEQRNQSFLFEAEHSATRESGPVTCLGLTFPNDEKLRKHFPVLLRTENRLLHRRL